MLKIKSKAVLAFAGLMVAAFMFVGAVNTASADLVTLPAAGVSKASSMENIKNLQTFLNWNLGSAITPLVVDGKYGAKTTAAIRMFQTNNGLTADGVFGKMSTAKAMALQANVSGGTYPAGCASATGYSSTTGQPCTASVSTVPGCMAGALFSSTTGASCSTGTPVSQTGEGSITVDYDAIPAANVVIQKGLADQSAAALKIKATGSDMKISRAWFDVNARLWLYANEASLVDGSTVLGTIQLTSSSLAEVTVGSKWQLQFNNLNVVIPAGGTKILTLKLSRPTLTNSSGVVTIQTSSTVRASDAAGFSDTYAFSATRAMNLTTTSALAGTLTTNLNASSPKAQSVSGLSTTAGVLTPVKLGDFDFKAKDSAIKITEVVSTLAGGTIANMVASVELRDGTTVLSSVTGAATATFSSLNVDIAKDTTKTLSVWAQMNPIGTPGAGYTTKGQGITATLDSSATVSTDAEWNTVTVTSADPVGGTQYMFQYAPTITLGTASAVQVDGSAVGEFAGSYSLSFVVTAPADSDIYVNTPATIVGGSYPVAKIAAYGGTLASSTSVSGLAEFGATLTTWNKISAGSSRTFTVTAQIPDGTAAGFTGVTMATNGINWSELDSGTGTVQTWGLSDIKTGTVYVTL